MKAVGEEFTHRGGKIIVVRDKDFGGCCLCCFQGTKCSIPVLECRSDYREDGESVHFEEEK